MKKLNRDPFVGVYVCHECNYRLPWRVRDREWFPRSWKTTCPHCTGKLRLEER
jgi:hypothetical protein